MSELVFGEHITPYLSWATTFDELKEELAGLLEALEALAWDGRYHGVTMAGTHLGLCGRFFIAQYTLQRWSLNLASEGGPGCDPVAIEVEAWLAANKWAAPQAHCDDCVEVASGRTCGYWVPNHLFGEPGACRPYHHVDIPPGTPTGQIAGQLVDAFVWLFAVSTPAHLFMEACLWNRSPHALRTDVDFDALRQPATDVGPGAADGATVDDASEEPW